MHGCLIVSTFLKFLPQPDLPDQDFTPTELKIVKILLVA